MGNRRLRTIDELESEELRQGFLKLKRTAQERMSLKDPNDLGRIADLVNSKSISRSIDFVLGRGELAQVVDQTNPISQLTHERRRSALGPGGLNRKRAVFDVRDVHIFFFFNDTATTEIYTLSLHDALPISVEVDDVVQTLNVHYTVAGAGDFEPGGTVTFLTAPTGGSDVSIVRNTPITQLTNFVTRSEEHTSELQSRRDLVCRLLLEKKKKK